jgi:hypothetical protein
VWWQTLVILGPVGGLKWEDHSPGWHGEKLRPYLQNKQSQKGWRCGSDRRGPA